MEFLMVVCAAIAVGAMILSFLFLRLSQREAEKAVSFADDARSERLCVQSIEEEVEQRVIGLEAWAKSFVEELEGAESLAAKYAEKAERFSETADFSQQAAESYFLQTREQADKVIDIAEVVKLEVAKIETLIAKLNKDRAENPPFVSITYGEESGEAEKVEIPCITVDRNPPELAGLGVVYQRWVDQAPAGTPFEFKPTQVHPVVTEGGE